MYNLGEHFKLDLNKAKCNPESVIKGNKYRISILTDNLIRLEYSETGMFTDLPTELVINRSFTKSEYSIKEDKNYLEITTKYAKIMYSKDKNFDSGKVNYGKNLSVRILNTDKSWYYGHPEVRNIGTVTSGYEKNISKANSLSSLKLGKGLYSYDGFVSIDDSNSKLINEDGIFIDKDYKSLDIYLFIYNDDFDKCLTDYFNLTGYPILLPRYALGNWWNKNENYIDNDISSLVDSFRNNKVPLSMITLNNWYNKKVLKKGTLNSGFTFDLESFKNPALLVDYLHKSGIYLGVTINPFNGFYDNEKYYDKALTYLEEKDGSIPFNVMDPKAVDVYLKLFMHPLDNIGVDFYDIDYNSKLNNLVYLNHYLNYDLKRNYKKRSLIISSYAGLSSHRYLNKASKLTVSWDALKTVAIYNIMSSTNGCIWTHDALYKDGIEDNELYIRYLELLTFSPILRLSSEKGKYYKREPWRWSIKTNTIVTEFLNLRHKLIPYIYSEMYKYSRGKLFIKPVFFDIPKLYDDETYYNEYYFGSELLVSPIIKNKDMVMNRNVQKTYMPEGTWYDFFSGKKYPGDKEYVSFYREQDYPVFAHAGSIIPMGMNENINDTNPPKNMEIHIFPGKNNTYELYEDDGISNMYEKGFYLLTEIDYNYMPNNYTVIIRAKDGKSGIIPDHRNYKIVFRNTKKADDVTVYSNDLKMEYTSYVNGPDFIVEVKNAKTIGQITVNCKGKDIEIDALRIINTDIERILSDIEIPTDIKEKVDNILFDKNMDVAKKRIAIRKVKGLDGKFERLFLRLLEYINQV